MAKFRKRPVVIEAVQWFQYGDGPRDAQGDPIVRYYRLPTLDGERKCNHCGAQMYSHGWVDTLEGGHIVCPSDRIITGTAGEHYPCKNEIFVETYEPVEKDAE